MNRIAAASGAFNAFGSISCMLTVKRIWTCHMEFALYKLIIIKDHVQPPTVSQCCVTSSTFQIYETQGRVYDHISHDENVA